MKGSLLQKILEQGRKNIGNGGFLQYNENIIYENGTWKLNGSPLVATSTYRVALTDFLFTGKEANLEFLLPGNPGIVKVYEPATSVSDSRSDIRLAIIRYLEGKK